MCLLAERVGFEPTNTFWVLLEFQSSAFGRSATSPSKGAQAYRSRAPRSNRGNRVVQNLQPRNRFNPSKVGVLVALGKFTQLIR